MRTICCSRDSIVYSVWNDRLIVDQVTAVQVSSCNADRRYMYTALYLSTLYTHNVHNKHRYNKVYYNTTRCAHLTTTI